MKARLIVAGIGIPLLLVILLFLPPICLALTIGLVSCIASREFYAITDLKFDWAVGAATFAMGFFIPLWCCAENDLLILASVCFAFFVFVYIEAIFKYEGKHEVGLIQLGSPIFAGVIVPLLLTSLVVLKNSENGSFAVLIPFVIAYICDSCALFGGMLFGKHKLSPKVSPNKTVEGAVIGSVMAGVGMLVYGLVMEYVFDFTVDYAMMCFMGVLISILGQFGDLAFSLMKRICGIKDYGKILPGHGGALDRCDSLLFISPTVLLFILRLEVFYR